MSVSTGTKGKTGDQVTHQPVLHPQCVVQPARKQGQNTVVYIDARHIQDITKESMVAGKGVDDDYALYVHT